jgi:hypothetical protein
VINKNIDIAARVKILDSDILKKIFAVVMKSTKYDLIDLMIEDLNINFGVDNTIQGKMPRICWTAYLHCTVFRGDTGGSKFTCTDMNLFLPFLTKVRVGARNEYGDPVSIMIAVTSIILVKCIDTTNFNSQNRGFMREDWCKTILR